MISLGEILAAALASDSHSSRSITDEYLMVALLVSLAAVIKLAYFDAVRVFLVLTYDHPLGTETHSTHRYHRPLILALQG